MAQIFKRKANIYARVALISIVTLPWIIILVGSQLSRSPYNTKVGVALDQPVPFSHRHHATELGIDCRFCHHDVEKGAHAGLPSTETCMRCHIQTWKNSPLLEPVRQSYNTGQPIVWNLVNKVPEFVYFNHSIHVNRGISCSQCHGRIQDEHLTEKGNAFEMRWCLDCHRNTEKNLYKDPDAEKKGLSPKEQVFNLYLKHQAGAPLSERERCLLENVEYKPTAEELKEGRAIQKNLKIKTAQLEDCWICHH